MTCRHTRAGRSGFLPDRTVHLHPLRRCNLACKHCYSNSNPQASGMLGMDVLAPALETLRAEGYELLSLSGGEPMLYPELEALCAHARDLGFRIAGITNGFRVNARFAHLIDCFDAMAVSFDGPREVHNDVRDNPRAFDMGVRALEHLAEIGKPSAAAFTASQASMAYIPDFVEMAADIGVRAVQLRPLVMAGRAARDYADPALDSNDLTRLWLMGQALASAYDGQPFVHTDLAHARDIADDRDAWEYLLGGQDHQLSDLINPLVITPDGDLNPFTFDFPRVYGLGRIDDLAARNAAPVKARVPAVRGLVQRVLDNVADEDQFIDWFAYCRDQGLCRVA